MSDAKHTPGPWIANANKILGLDGRLVTMLDDLETTCAEDEANAEFIVRAANAHDALVEALEAVEWGCGGQPGHCPCCGELKIMRLHADDCKLAAALRVGRGED